MKKIENKVEIMDVKGQGCGDDCAEWSGATNTATSGCKLGSGCNITCLL